ncbi:MAG: T9SS type A sorting domain-containing protein [Ignavibacterium album]|uniref:T9SS type A sorting domain-containing protein n=1 Tax=Ignavibacterium album TaxID=591197 RepID=UPI0026EDF1F4|nr:T9SS type A sorting domain-containing protein [Ignavibacterium album]MBI5661098.1 T9SS type A sorting domain-containing protein [Ignavibacterium album]
MKNFFHFTFNFIILISSASFSQGSELNIGANYILYPSNVNQSEVFITAHPTNPDVLFASANTIVFVPFFVSEGIYVTTNGGNNWFGSDTCNGPNISFHQGDPGVSIDRYGRFILTRLGKQPFYGIYSHYSTDNGINWSPQKTITSEGEFEKASIVSDNNPTSPYYGRTYATWVKLSGTFPVEFSFTDDISQSWNQILTINSFTQRSSGADIEIGNNGEVFIAYALVSDISPFNETAISFAKSIDGGTTWSVMNNVFPINGINGTLPQKSNIRVNGLPRIAVDKSNSSNRGTIYIVTTQKNLAPAGSDPDIILYKSTDNGLSWSGGIRVNQDALNNGKTQYFPAIDVDQYGGINIIYYDDRTTTNDSASVFLSRSTDGGLTWSDFNISDHNFKPQPIGGLGQGYQGDNIDIVCVGDKMFPVWMDNSTGIYQIWTAAISINPNNVEDAIDLITDFRLFQNYPNPFNPSTRISWQSPVDGWQTLKIFDVLGNEVATLVNEFRPKGFYEINFSIAQWPEINLKSGIYFYQLNVGEYTETKKMVLIR